MKRFLTICFSYCLLVNFAAIAAIEQNSNLNQEKIKVVKNETRKKNLPLRAETKLYLDLIGVDSSQIKETALVDAISKAYVQDDLRKVAALTELLALKYPRSTSLDDVIYMQGMLEYRLGVLGEALKTFEQILINQPESSKVPAALFAKGMIYKKLNLPRLALDQFTKIQSGFAGSPEAERAGFEVKVMNRERL